MDDTEEFWEWVADEPADVGRALLRAVELLRDIDADGCLDFADADLLVRIEPYRKK